MGYRTLDDGAVEVRGSKAATDLAAALWPLQEAHMWSPDRF
jgi:hypothetical protein